MKSVQLQHLTIGYLGKHHPHVVATGLEAAINPGELTCLLGRNGIGKSTLLRTLSGFQPALEGEVMMMETPLSTCSDQQLSRIVGVVLTEKLHVRNMTVYELVALGRSPYTDFWGRLSAEDKAQVDKALTLVGIEALRNRMVQTLSDGERQKVMIAKTLAQQTPVIYLDEPTAFLDFPSKVEMMQLLRRLAHDEEKTVFLSTHDVELSLQMADRLWLMEPDGLSVGTPQELAANGVLSRFIERDGIRFDAATLTIHISK